ncbi:MAG: hypothetical protein WC496_09000 [Phycisphaerae bacterium]|jgi:hypothetical protein
MTKEEQIKKLEDLLNEFNEFYKSSNTFDILKFEKWKIIVSKVLGGNYKIRFNRLNFYKYINDEIPF